MALAEGRRAWWNQFGSVLIDECVKRAKAARLRGVIAKWGYPQQRDAFALTGIPWATERYVYTGRPEQEARRLAEDIAPGARFAVITAEIEWEPLGPQPMQRITTEFRRLQPHADVYACVDTRGGRRALPYQRVLAEHIAGWMPMVYPGAFQQSVREAFASALDGADFRGKPVLPAIQTYDTIGASTVREQIDEVQRGHLRGYQAYTISHATDEE